MEMILNLFKKKEFADEYQFVEEEYMFQHSHKKYYLRDINGKKELWAFDVKNENEKYYLGKVEGDRIILSTSFRTLPWDVQKGAGKLCRAYLHNDWREL